MNKKHSVPDEVKRAIVNYLSDKYTMADSDILNNWLEKHPYNKLLFDQISDIFKASYFKNVEALIDEDKAWNDIQNQIRIKKGFYPEWKLLLRYAAVFVLAVVMGGVGFYLLDKKSERIFNQQDVVFTSPLGSRSLVQLADGSKVWLNAGTTLQYNNMFGKNNRNIQLWGEAFFDVAKNEKLPFSVHTSDLKVIALGTKFNVKAYEEENTIETTLVKGSVKLEAITAKLVGNINLKPNEKAVFTKSNGVTEIVSSGPDEENSAPEKPKLEIIRSIETAPISSWKDKRWIIQNENLGQLATKLERRFNVNFIFDDEVLKEFYFGGTLEDESLEQILKAISYASPIKYAIQDNTVIITSDNHKMNKFKKLLME